MYILKGIQKCYEILYTNISSNVVNAEKALSKSLQTVLAAISGGNTTTFDPTPEVDSVDEINPASSNYTAGDDSTDGTTISPIDITDIISSNGGIHAVQGRQAIARVIVDRNTTAVVLFEQDGDSVKYDLFVVLSGSSDGCISWDAAIAPTLNPGSNECPIFTDTTCLKTLKPDICAAGPFGFGECGTGQGKAGIKLGKHEVHSNTPIYSGRTNMFNLLDNDPYTVIGRSVMIAFTPHPGAKQRISCGITQLGEGEVNNFFPFPDSSGSRKHTSLSEIFSILLLVAAFYFVYV
ncbi:hypothetical protein J3Q64DRAFT_1823345 [Phycomyces blakesleeanus]|uniref:Superoxide dismutase copper/zinc binding domain-containing protein n=1 Tax=Phycomyces blakesleeanus TaxID=4837 RepID=A0ABR3AUE1_PHYBL